MADVMPCRDSIFHLRPASPRAVLRVKSWQLATARGDRSPRSAFADSVGAVIQGSLRVLCTGPGEWLLVCPPIGVARLRNVLAPELTTQGLALVDLTDGLAVFEVSGSAVREVLAKGCGLDFDPRCFAAGQCARTRFAQIPVVIDCTQESGVFELYVPRSYAHYLKDWLPGTRHAALQHKCPVLLIYRSPHRGPLRRSTTEDPALRSPAGSRRCNLLVMDEGDLDSWFKREILAHEDSLVRYLLRMWPQPSGRAWTCARTPTCESTRPRRNHDLSPPKRSSLPPRAT